MNFECDGKAVASAALGVGVVAGVVSVAASVALARTAVRVEEASERVVRVIRVVAGSPTRVWIEGEGVRAAGPQSLLFESPQPASLPTPRHTPQRTPFSDPRREPYGHARLGPVLARSGAAVLREVEQIDRGELLAGAAGRMVGWWYIEPSELGYRVERTTYESELGPMDAWVVYPKRPRKKRWAVHVHGRGASPEETFRGIAALSRAGVTSLIITYRNDEHQPSGRMGRYGLGVSESHDVDAAIGAALDRGAKRVTLVGWSMGGTASLVAAARGTHRHHIDGLVLDSPGVDWPGLLRWQARARHVPGCIAQWGMGLLRAGMIASGEASGIDFRLLTPEGFARELTVPTLILVGPDDRFVPWTGAVQLAELQPDLVRIVPIAGAGHVRLWNADPERWEQEVLNFVAGLPEPRHQGR